MENCKMKTAGKTFKGGIKTRKGTPKKKTASKQMKRGKAGMMQEKMAGSVFKPFMM